MNLNNDVVIKPGQVWAHFKGNMYRIVGVGRNTSDLRYVVIYENIDRTGGVWVRDLEEFLEPLDKTLYPEAKQKHRFELRGE